MFVKVPCKLASPRMSRIPSLYRACKLTASQSTDPYTLLVMPPQKNLLSRVLQFNRAEKTSDKEYRAVFPYGTFDEEGLREFLKMHEAKQTSLVPDSLALSFARYPYDKAKLEGVWTHPSSSTSLNGSPVSRLVMSRRRDESRLPRALLCHTGTGQSLARGSLVYEAKADGIYEVQCEREWFNAVEPIVNRPLSSLNRHYTWTISVHLT